MSKRYEHRAQEIVSDVEKQDANCAVDLDRLHDKVLEALEDAEQEVYDCGLDAGCKNEYELPDHAMEAEEILQLMVAAGLCKMPANTLSRTPAEIRIIFRDLEYKYHLDQASIRSLEEAEAARERRVAEYAEYLTRVGGP